MGSWWRWPMIDLYIYIKLFNYVVRLFVTVACGCQDFLVSHIAYDLYITRVSSYRNVICLLACGLITVYIFGINGYVFVVFVLCVSLKCHACVGLWVRVCIVGVCLSLHGPRFLRSLPLERYTVQAACCIISLFSPGIPQTRS